MGDGGEAWRELRAVTDRVGLRSAWFWSSSEGTDGPMLALLLRMLSTAERAALRDDLASVIALLHLAADAASHRGDDDIRRALSFLARALERVGELLERETRQ